MIATSNTGRNEKIERVGEEREERRTLTSKAGVADN